jgi:hypothetical protein
MAELLGTSLKAAQSFGQGWRNIPVCIKRQMLFLLAKKDAREREHEPCCGTERCPMETGKKCPAWEVQGGPRSHNSVKISSKIADKKYDPMSTALNNA